MVGQRGACISGGQFFEDFFNELKEVVHLLELAARVLVDLAVAREYVQFFEKLDGLAGAQVELIAGGLDLGGGVFGHGGIVCVI